jgi:hypothetical protein
MASPRRARPPPRVDSPGCAAARVLAPGMIDRPGVPATRPMWLRPGPWGPGRADAPGHPDGLPAGARGDFQGRRRRRSMIRRRPDFTNAGPGSGPSLWRDDCGCIDVLEHPRDRRPIGTARPVGRTEGGIAIREILSRVAAVPGGWVVPGREFAQRKGNGRSPRGRPTRHPSGSRGLDSDREMGISARRDFLGDHDLGFSGARCASNPAGPLGVYARPPSRAPFPGARGRTYRRGRCRPSPRRRGGGRRSAADDNPSRWCRLKAP